MIKILRNCLLILTFVSTSCEKNNTNFTIEPRLEFNDIRILPGVDLLGNSMYNLTLFLEYSDGDANLGRKYVTDDDLNCTVASFKKFNGHYSPIIEFQNPFYLNIPEIPEPKNTYQKGPITINTKTVNNGEMQIRIAYIPQLTTFKNGDTLKITVQVRDNDNNYSNLAEREFVYHL
jgi:hypothetical protein